MSANSFGAAGRLASCGREYTYYRLSALDAHGVSVARLPYCIRILLENLLRHEDGVTVTADHILAVARWDPTADPSSEIAFTPARVLLQDFTGVPCVVDLAAMRQAVVDLGGDPSRVSPLQPVELVIDHSVHVDAYGSGDALSQNTRLEYERNRERYSFLKWGQKAFDNFRVVPPNTGIVHQVNLEHLARVVCAQGEDSAPVAFPDTLVGTDSHTTMVNGLGVLGWGVGGIEAEAAMLGQPISMLVPQVVGFRLMGALCEGATATDLVLTVTEMLRRHGVVGRFVEFFGPGLAGMPLADRATLANMAPEYGATCGIFPIDHETIAYLRLTGRTEEQVDLVERYARAQGLYADADAPEATYSAVVELDLRSVETSIAGPRRPHDRIPLSRAAASFREALPAIAGPAAVRPGAVHVSGVPVELDGKAFTLNHGAVVIAAITSCANTSNPSVMLAAGLLAQKAVDRGVRRKPWVKTSLAPGSRVVTKYLDEAGVLPFLELVGFNLVGYGCTTCIGNSGPLPRPISEAIARGRLVVCSVLSGNRNFEGRIQHEVRANYLMSPPLVVAYALAGRMDIDLLTQPIGSGTYGEPVYLRDLWPTHHEVNEAAASALQTEAFRSNYASVFEGDAAWEALDSADGALYPWNEFSTYIKLPPYFRGMERDAPGLALDVRGARALVVLGDSTTTDHISPAGSIRPDSPAGCWLIERGVHPREFNSYGARRGHHEVMVRGTFASTRLRNRLAPETEGGWTTYLPTGEIVSIFDASMRYRSAGTPLLVIAGKEYGCGSSRDWAAKGPYLQGVRAVLAESFERIHRSNLVGMGIAPIQFLPGETADTLGLTGREVYDICGIEDAVRDGVGPRARLTVTADDASGARITFAAVLRVDTPKEFEYMRNGGILQYMVRRIARMG